MKNPFKRDKGKHTRKTPKKCLNCNLPNGVVDTVHRNLDDSSKNIVKRRCVLCGKSWELQF